MRLKKPPKLQWSTLKSIMKFTNKSKSQRGGGILFFKSRPIPSHDDDYWDHTPELKDDTQTPTMPEAEKEYDVQVFEKIL